MNKRLALKRAFREAARNCVRHHTKGWAVTLERDIEWKTGRYEMENLEIDVYPDQQDVVQSRHLGVGAYPWGTGGH